MSACGQFRASSGLETYYRRLGFDVLALGEGISLSERLTVPIGLNPESGERFFLRWRVNTAPFRREFSARFVSGFRQHPTRLWRADVTWRPFRQ